MSRIKNIIMDAVALNKLDDRGVADLIRYLEEDWEIRYAIWLETEEYYRKNDLEYGVDQYNQMHNTNHEFSASEMNLMLEDFNDAIDNSDEWCYTRMRIVERWCRDKEEENV